MNTTQNGSYTPDWSGLNTTIRPFLTFCVTAGLIGNTLVLVLFCRLKRLKTWDNAFTINLAVGDLTNSIAAIALVFSPELLTARIISCHSLSVMQVCRIANSVCLQEIALLRYWRVHKQGRIIKKSVFVTGLLIPWTVGIAFRSVVLRSTPDYHGVSQCVENTLQWASYQIRKIAGCACAGNAGNVFPRRRFQRKLLVSDPGMHHGTCVPHVPWCMSGSLTCDDGEIVPGIPDACAPAILRIWQEAHWVTLSPGHG